jgi:hypothetical protein
VALALLGSFLVRQARASEPLMPLRIFRSRNVTGANLIHMLMVPGLFGMFFLGVLYLERVLGYDAIEIGLAFPAIVTLAMSGATARDAGLASGLVNTPLQVGGALGLATLATLATSRTAAPEAAQSPAVAATDNP